MEIRIYEKILKKQLELRPLCFLEGNKMPGQIVISDHSVKDLPKQEVLQPLRQIKHVLSWTVSHTVYDNFSEVIQIYL